MKKTILLFFLSLTILYAQNEMNPGIHGGVGTDLNLGLAVGI